VARIRTIKPQFWTSKQIASIPKGTALFFIALWNFAEDDGVISIDPRTLSLCMPIFRSQDIEKMVNALWKQGLIKRSPSDGLALITRWEHQKIDKPRTGKYNTKEIQWLEYVDSTTSSDLSSNDRRKDSIGEDGKGYGEDMFNEAAEESASPRSPSKKSEASEGSKIWDAYSKAFERRYQVTPVRNAKTNSQCSQLAKRLGKDAIPVTQFYITHNDGWLVKTQHALGHLVMAAESYHTQWQRGQAVTSVHVRQFEKQSGNMELLEKVRRGEA
jgi:hypothetical protein